MRLSSRMVPITVALGLLLSVVLAPAHIASADDWCWNDPIVRIDGKDVRILTGVQGGPTDVDANVEAAIVRVTVPYGTRAQVVSVTNFLYREAAFIEYAPLSSFADADRLTRDGRIPVRVELSFFAKKSFPSQLVIESQGNAYSASGTTLTTTTIAFSIRH